ncbi:hypothetical protein ACN47E_001515 [Coniothyrium glycines]
MDANATRPTVDQLRHVANNYPLIDHHAHNLILPDQATTIPFEIITTEAQGRALRDTFKSLPHLRAARQLRQLYECSEDADWADILEQRVEWLRSNPDRLHQQCFEGIHALLIEDGHAGPERVYPYDHHDQYTTAPTKRIVRIETVAERLMRSRLRKADESDLGDSKFLPNTWVKFTNDFEREIQDAIADPDVAGFKTVICYRSGLDIEPDYEEAAKAVGHPFERYVKNCIRKRNYRIEKKAVNDYLVLRTLEILSERKSHSDALAKPLQFHTGFGDNDVNLVESNPAFLQQVIENYPNVPFVLLHSAYPFTREAGYLATVYRHVYLDIGEVFPMISRDGQRATLRQAMELAPGSKLLYSSNGHWFPETFYLANIQFREVWLEVLQDMISTGDITPHQGIGMTKDILFNNANVLYDLRYEAVFDERIQDAPRQLTYNPRQDDRSPLQPPAGPTPGRTPEPTTRTATFDVPATRSISPLTPAVFPPPPVGPQVYDTQLFVNFRQANPKVKFVYVQWLDYQGALQTRVIPMKELERIVQQGERIEIPIESTGILRSGTSQPESSMPDRIFVKPDLRSLRQAYNKSPLPAAMVFSYWRDEAGHAIATCPRNSLEILINALQYNYATTLLVGFELQITFSAANKYVSLPESTDWLQLPFFTDIILALDETGIEVQQYYAQDPNSRYSFVLAPQPPLLAVDTLILTRQIITQIAGQHEIKATLPFDGAARSATRATISLNPPAQDMQFFVGGVLAHLPALSAFSKCEDSSYNFDTPEWVAWSSKNANIPLQRRKQGQWDLRNLDGQANMYFVLSAVIAAGLLGLASGETQFAQHDAPSGVDHMDAQTRAQYGIVQQLPRSVAEAIAELKRDGPLLEALSPGMVMEYIRLKEGEGRKAGSTSGLERALERGQPDRDAQQYGEDRSLRQDDRERRARLDSDEPRSRGPGEQRRLTSTERDALRSEESIRRERAQDAQDRFIPAESDERLDAHER